jgi:hypothetical protein
VQVVRVQRGGPLFTVGDMDRETPVYTHLHGHGCEGYVTTHVTDSKHVTA